MQGNAGDSARVRRHCSLPAWRAGIRRAETWPWSLSTRTWLAMWISNSRAGGEGLEIEG
jgi:hypothetical protein